MFIKVNSADNTNSYINTSFIVKIYKKGTNRIYIYTRNDREYEIKAKNKEHQNNIFHLLANPSVDPEELID